MEVQKSELGGGKKQLGRGGAGRADLRQKNRKKSDMRREKLDLGGKRNMGKESVDLGGGEGNLEDWKSDLGGGQKLS